MKIVSLLALVAVVAGCSGGAEAPAGPTPTPFVAPTEAPVLGSGVITFGAAYDPNTLQIAAPKTSFKTTSKTIAWSASFSEPAGATTLTFILASRSSTGIERILIKQDVDVSNPSFDLLANDADLALLVGRKAGTYVMRYLRESTVLAEGRFTLTK